MRLSCSWCENQALSTITSGCQIAMNWLELFPISNSVKSWQKNCSYKRTHPILETLKSQIYINQPFLFYKGKLALYLTARLMFYSSKTGIHFLASLGFELSCNGNQVRRTTNLSSKPTKPAVSMFSLQIKSSWNVSQHCWPKTYVWLTTSNAGNNHSLAPRNFEKSHPCNLTFGGMTT